MRSLSQIDLSFNGAVVHLKHQKDGKGGTNPELESIRGCKTHKGSFASLQSPGGAY